jgi:hypothetical protein
MLRTWRWTAGRWTACGFLLAAVVVFAQTSNPPSSEAPAAPPKPQHKLQHKKSKKTEKPVVLPAMPGGPLRQLPMDQIPATPAKVTYEGGLLTISAQNSPMGEILRDVRKLTGASIDIPPHASAADERVITHIGPGTPRDVLVTLLNGSSFNYVMLGSDTDPAVVSSIILTSKTPPGGEPPTAVANSNPAPGVVMPPRPVGAPQAFNPQGQQQQPVQPGGEVVDEGNTDEPADDSANADDQAQPDVNGANAQEQQQQQDANQPNAGPKTPEQILEMLRRPQQPGGANVPPPPPQE